MNADRLLALYERIADAPDAVARLRRFILDLAVRGKLVPQDPNDEPASELLKRIAKEKSLLAGKGAIRRGIASRQIQNNERPFVVPTNWVWVRLHDIGSWSGGMTPSMHRTDFWGGDIAWLSPKDIKSDEVCGSQLRITEKGLEETRLELYRPGCLFMVARSGILKRTFPVAINRVPAAANQDLKVLVPFLEGLERYLQFMFRGMTDFILVKLVKAGTTVQSLKYEEFERQPFPIPPLAEQRRIVAKVDELMALCDRLELARKEREAARDRLAAASLARLNTPDPETFRDDARFALNAFPALTTRPDQIKQLRQTILNLAVRGKLVPQDPSDEPASELLKRISKEKGRPRRMAVAIDRGAEPYPIPETWKWAALDELITSGPQNGISPKPTTREDAPMAITLTATTAGIFNPIHFKRVEAKIPSESEFWLQDGDLLFQRGNTREYVGIAAVYEGPPNKFLFPDLIMKVRVSDIISLRFVHIASISPPSRAYFSENASGAQATMPKINQKTLVSLPLPLPPLAEQHRIVAKVDELMALCDRLEESLTKGDDTRRRLLESLLAEALAPAGDREREAAE